MTLRTMPRELANKGCRRCNTMIKQGEKYARGAFGYEYLCERCAGELGVDEQ